MEGASSSRCVNLIPVKLCEIREDNYLLSDEEGTLYELPIAAVDITRDTLIPLDQSNYLKIVPDTEEIGSDVEEILNENSEKQSKKWSREATLMLISLYKTNYKTIQNNSKKNCHAWGTITEEMNKKGYPFKLTQIQSRFKYLKSEYLKKKDNMGSKGSGEAPIHFDYLEELDDIFGRKDNVVPVATACSSRGYSCENSIESKQQCDDDGTKNPKRTKLEKKIYGLMQFFEERDLKREENIEKRHKEIQSMREKSITVYKDTMEKLLEKFDN